MAVYPGDGPLWGAFNAQLQTYDVGLDPDAYDYLANRLADATNRLNGHPYHDIRMRQAEVAAATLAGGLATATRSRDQSRIGIDMAVAGYEVAVAYALWPWD
jgi:hypothetical protein